MTFCSRVSFPNLQINNASQWNTAAPSYVANPSVGLNRSHKRGGLSSGDYTTLWGLELHFHSLRTGGITQQRGHITQGPLYLASPLWDMQGKSNIFHCVRSVKIRFQRCGRICWILDFDTGVLYMWQAPTKWVLSRFWKVLRCLRFQKVHLKCFKMTPQPCFYLKWFRRYGLEKVWSLGNMFLRKEGLKLGKLIFREATCTCLLPSPYNQMSGQKYTAITF